MPIPSPAEMNRHCKEDGDERRSSARQHDPEDPRMAEGHNRWVGLSQPAISLCGFTGNPAYLARSIAARTRGATRGAAPYADPGPLLRGVGSIERADPGSPSAGILRLGYSACSPSI